MLKKFIFLLIVIPFIAGCSTGNIYKLKESKSVYELDFLKYSKKGFLYTPFEYRGDYEAISVIYLEFYPGYERIVTSTQSHGGGSTFANRDLTWIKTDVSIVEMLDSAYTLAKRKGANAIVDLKINEEEKEYDLGREGILTVRGISIRGFAIKRK